MAVCLRKGQKVDLTKTNPGLKKITVGLGWDVNRYDSGAEFDLDASAFMLGANGKCPEERAFIFYGNATDPSESLIYGGDNRTGEGEGDDEVIVVDFSKVPADVEKIAITVTIYDAESRKQNFGQVSNAYVRVAKMSGPEDYVGVDSLRFDLVEEFSVETALVVCEIYKKNGEWKFNAVGAGYSGGLAALGKAYGVNIG